jgi:hypothetical protein
MKVDDAFLQMALENSYKDFHAKGLDYICLVRSEFITIKVYLLDGDATKVPEVVNPHDHRYKFRTEVLRGEMTDYSYERVRMRGPDDDMNRGEVYQEFDYLTPLCGGDGFTYRRENRLEIVAAPTIRRGETLQRRASDIHTISMRSDQCALLLTQYADEVPVGVPTRCWVRKGAPAPDTSGLYSRFTEDEMIQKLKLIREITL